MNFQMFKLDLEKEEEQKIKLPTSTESLKRQESSRKLSISASWTMPNTLNVWITTNYGKFFKRWEYQTTWPASWVMCMQFKKEQLELDIGTTDWFQIGKGIRQFSSVTQSCLTPCNPMDRNTPGLPVHHQLPEFTQTHVHWVGDAVQTSHPLLLLPSIFPSSRVFSNESALHIRWPKYWSFSFNISPSNEYSGLVSFRMHWLDLLAVQGTLKRLLQYHSSKHQLFGTQLS